MRGGRHDAGRGEDNEGIRQVGHGRSRARRGRVAQWLHQQLKSATAGEDHCGRATEQLDDGRVPGRDQAALQLSVMQIYGVTGVGRPVGWRRRTWRHSWPAKIIPAARMG
jgi:hypothetical protein